MQLRTLLSHPGYINLLWKIHSKISPKDKQYSINVDELGSFEQKELFYLQMLGLISTDKNDVRTNISITNKGNKFIETFSKLKDIIEHDTVHHSINIEYHLTPKEKIFLTKLKKKPMDYDKKVLHDYSILEELKLICTDADHISITEKGKEILSKK